MNVHTCLYALAHSHLHVDISASSCTNRDIYVLICTHICPYTYARMHTDTMHTYLLTCKNVHVHKHMHIHTQKCTCSLTHWQTLTLTCAVANAHTNADRHKYALRHRHMHMHMRKHSLSPHSENQDSTGQLSASAPDNFQQVLESPVLRREIKCRPSLVDLMTAEGFCGLDRSGSTGCVLIRGKREGLLGSKLQGLFGTFTLFTCKVCA